MELELQQRLEEAEQRIAELKKEKQQLEDMERKGDQSGQVQSGAEEMLRIADKVKNLDTGLVVVDRFYEDFCGVVRGPKLELVLEAIRIRQEQIRKEHERREEQERKWERISREIGETLRQVLRQITGGDTDA